MNNYTKENLIALPPESVPAGTLAMKVGDTVFTPGNIRISSGGSMDLYKCASVDKTNKTWTGYKASFSNGVYSFETTPATALTYGSGYTPVEGNIYNTGALICVKVSLPLIPGMFVT